MSIVACQQSEGAARRRARERWKESEEREKCREGERKTVADEDVPARRNRLVKFMSP